MDAAELTLKQLLDAPWTRRLSRAFMILLFPVVGAGGSFVGWIIHENAQRAGTAAELAAEAVKVAAAVSDKQDDRANLADQRSADEKAWRDRLDAGLTRVNVRISTEIGRISEDMGEIKGSLGELKGLILRQQASAPWAGVPGNVMATQVEIPRYPLQENGQSHRVDSHQ